MAAPSYGLIATFDTTPDLYHAAEKVRDAGYRNWDCITPFPVHGLDKAMGLKRSIVPRISLCGGIAGFCTGMSMIPATSGQNRRTTGSWTSSGVPNVDSDHVRPGSAFQTPSHTAGTGAFSTTWSVA